MRGSDKQIKWADEIRARIVKTLENGIEMQKEVAPENVSNINGFTALLELVRDFDGYAGEMIAVFKDVNCNGDVRHDLREVLLAIRALGWILPPGELPKQLKDVFFAK